MVVIGEKSANKAVAINNYLRKLKDVDKVIIFSPTKFEFDTSFINGKVEVVSYENIIEYKYFYRLMQEIDNHTLLVINECLRVQNRRDLTYNCIRNIGRNTKSKLIFNYLPLIDNEVDFMTLFDFDTDDKFYKFESKFNAAMVKSESLIVIKKQTVPIFNPIFVQTSKGLKERYEIEKKKLFENIGIKDPHTIPRNLYLLSGKEKTAYSIGRNLLVRNDRLKLPNSHTYKRDTYEMENYLVFELPHNFIDFSDAITLTGQQTFDVLITDLKVCAWYFDRYQSWANRIENTNNLLQ